MQDFFNVKTLEDLMEYLPGVTPVATEDIPLFNAGGRILARDVSADMDLPGFSRAAMDGYAVRAAATFGAGESNPAYLRIVGEVEMGRAPDVTVNPGEAAKISTGGMLPPGADSVLMVEHTETVDPETLEVRRSIAPGQDVIARGEDFPSGHPLLKAGCRLRPQEVGLLAAFGIDPVRVYGAPRIGILSTGDEIVAIDQLPGPGRMRDVNTFTLAGFIRQAGAIPVAYGIANDAPAMLEDKCRRALAETDMLILSGGSSVGARDYTVNVFSTLPDSEILIHGLSIRPGKPTILARSGHKLLWGLPGQVTSAMIVFLMAVRPFVHRLAGLQFPQRRITVAARLTRNLPSAPGRLNCVRVRLKEDSRASLAEPLLGRSGLLNSMVKADGIVLIEADSEGLEKGSRVDVILF